MGLQVELSNMSMAEIDPEDLGWKGHWEQALGGYNHRTGLYHPGVGGDEEWVQ